MVEESSRRRYSSDARSNQVTRLGKRASRHDIVGYSSCFIRSAWTKGSVAHEMKRIADLNHISVDCNDLRNKEIRLHDHHAKAVEAQSPTKEIQSAPLPPRRPADLTPHPAEASVPVPPRRPADLTPHPAEASVPVPPRRPADLTPHPAEASVPVPPRRPADLTPQPAEASAPLPPRRPADFGPAGPKVIKAPDFVDRNPQPHSREGYDVQSLMQPPIERCYQPNLLDLVNPLSGSFILLGRRDAECRLPPPDGNYDYYRREQRGYGHFSNRR